MHCATTVVTRSSRHHMPTRASWVHSGKGRELCSSPILTCSWQATLGGTFYPPHTLFYQSSPVHRALLRPMHAAAVVLLLVLLGLLLLWPSVLKSTGLRHLPTCSGQKHPRSNLGPTYDSNCGGAEYTALAGDESWESGEIFFCCWSAAV